MKMKKLKVGGVLLLMAAFLVTGLLIVGTNSAEAKTVLKVAHGGRNDLNLQAACLEFKKVAEELSGGSLEVKIYPNMALGTDRASTEAMILGNVEISIPTSFTLSNLAGMPEILVYDLPWLIHGRDNYYRVFKETKGIQTMKKRLEAKGIKYLGAGDIGPYGILGKKSIRKPADLEGQKIRTGESALVVDVFKALNVRPVVVNFGELYTAFQQGVMDGLYTTVPVVHMTKTYEVAKELTQLNTSYCMVWMVMNLKKYNSLTKAEQNALEKAGAAYDAMMQKTAAAQDKRVVAEMRKAGVKFHELTPREIGPFQKAVEPVYKSWRSKVGPEIFDELQNWTKKNTKK